MNLAEVFVGIASAEASEQSRLRLLEQSRQHARPIAVVLDKIQRVPDDAEIGHFQIVEYSTMGGDCVYSVGLKAQDGENDDNADINWNMISAGPAHRNIELFVSPDGRASAVRWDQMNEDWSVLPAKVSPTLIQAKTVNELMPTLASWVEDNMPHAAKALLPQNRPRQYAHGMAD